MIQRHITQMQSQYLWAHSAADRAGFPQTPSERGREGRAGAGLLEAPPASPADERPGTSADTMSELPEGTALPAEREQARLGEPGGAGLRRAVRMGFG